MTTRRLVEIDITGRTNGQVPAWNSGSGIHEYVDAGLYGGPTWTVGTSFPGTPGTGDRCTRTDRGIDYEYNGTRWLSTLLFPVKVPPVQAIPINATAIAWRGAVLYLGLYDLWIETFEGYFFISGGTALGASHKWVCTLTKQPAGTVLGTINIDSGASSAFRSSGQVSVGALLGTANFEFDVTATKTGTPGTLFADFNVWCRLVG